VNSRPTAAYALLILFGGVLMFFAIVMQGELAGRVVFLAFGTICLVAAGALRVLGRPRVVTNLTLEGASPWPGR
jgi:hypothetical protein